MSSACFKSGPSSQCIIPNTCALLLIIFLSLVYSKTHMTNTWCTLPATLVHTLDKPLGLQPPRLLRVLRVARTPDDV